MNHVASYLSLFVLLVPFVPAADAQIKDAPTYQLEDATGDVAFTVLTGVSTPGLPSVGYLTYVDFTGFSADDVDPLTLRLKMSTVAGFQPRAEQAVIFGFPVYYSFLFQVPGTEATPVYGVVTVYGYWDDTSAGSSPAIVGAAQFCLNTFYQDQYCGFAGTLNLEPQFEEQALILEVPKKELTRSGQFAQLFPQLPGKIRPGDALTRVQILAHTQLFGFTTIGGEQPNELRDYVPNGGAAPDLVFEHPSVTDDLQLGLTQVGVVAGEDNVVGLEIRNLADRKRLLDLSVDVASMDGDWTVSIAPNVTVRARDALNITLHIVPPIPGNGPLPSIQFQIRATVVTEPGVLAVIPVHLVASKALDRGAHTWYAHTAAPSGGLRGLPVTHDLLTYRDVWASRGENDPAATDELGVPMYFSGGTNGVDFTAMLVATDGIPNPARLGPGDAKAHLVIDSPYPMDVQVTSQIRTADSLIAVGTQEATFQRGPNEVDVVMAFDALATRLVPDDGYLQWDVTVHRPGIEGVPLAFVGIADYPDIAAKQSWFDLPLTREAVIPPDPDLPDVSLTMAEDPDAFVNPGRRTVFEWDLRNEHENVVELELVVDNLTRDWAHDVGPAGRLRLPAGHTIRVAVLLDAPADAREGEICEFKLLLQEPDTGRVFAGGSARAIVTAGVDVENETFEVDEADLAAVRPPPAKSPGVELVGLLVLGVFVAWVQRRRSLHE